MENNQQNFQQQPDNQPKKHKNNGSITGGVILITLGVLFLIDQFIPGVDFGDLWPVVLVVIGVVMIIRSTTGFSKK
jgi:phage shock protein C